MKMTILLGNGKRGTVNLVSSSIIVEDFKANICKKLKIDANQFKLKIDFLNNEIELLAVDIVEKSIEPNPQRKVETINAFFDNEKYMNICSTVDEVLPNKYSNRESYLLIDTVTKRTFKAMYGYGGWTDFMAKMKHDSILEVHANANHPKLLYTIKIQVKNKINSLPTGIRLVTWNGSKHYVYKNHMITLELDYMMELFNAQAQIKNDVVLDGSGVGSLGKYTKKINSIKDFKRYVDKGIN